MRGKGQKRKLAGVGKDAAETTNECHDDGDASTHQKNSKNMKLEDPCDDVRISTSESRRDAACEMASSENPASDVFGSSSLNCRGWFGSRWFTADDALENNGRCPAAVDRHDCDILQKFMRESLSFGVAGELSSLCLVAVKWADLKRSKADTRLSDGMLSSPVGILWSGDVKPLVHPDQASSYGKCIFNLFTH
jgi:hypothetical protein